MTNYSGVTTIAQSINNLILVTPQELTGIQAQPRGLLANERIKLKKGFLFDFNGEETFNFESDITDHYTEDNINLNDQIGLMPEHFVVSGFIGELTTTTPEVLLPLREAANRLTVITEFTPALSVTAQRAYNYAKQLYDVGFSIVDSAVSRWDSITNGSLSTQVSDLSGSDNIGIFKNQNEQQKAFQQFYGYWRSRTLFSVQTPWAVFRNMAIRSLRATQTSETRQITEFQITFKSMRFAQTISNTIEIANRQGRAANSIQEPVDKGRNTVLNVDTSDSKFIGAPGTGADPFGRYLEYNFGDLA